MPKINPYSNKSKKEEISEAPQVEELLKNLEFHKAIQHITNQINSAATIREIIIDIKEDIRKLFNIHILTIFLLDTPKKEIFTLERDGYETIEIRFPIDYSTFAGFVAQKKKMLHIADVYNERELRKINDALRFDSTQDKKTGIPTGQIIDSPILYNGMILGVMEIRNKKDGDRIDEYNHIFLDEIEGCLAKAFFLHLNFAETRQKYVAKFDKLIRDGVISSEQMDKALKAAFDSKEDLATILMTQYNISKSTIGTALADYFSCPYNDYNDDMTVGRDLLIGLSKSSLVNMLWIPLKVVKGKIHVLIEDPSNHTRKREIEGMLETNAVHYSVALAADILKLINRSYSEQKEKTRANGKSERITEVQPLQPDKIASAYHGIDVIVTHPETKIARENGIIPEPDPKSAPIINIVTAPQPAHNPEPPSPLPYLSGSKAGLPEAQITTAGTAHRQNTSQKAEADCIPGEYASAVIKPERQTLPSLNNIIFDACSRGASDIHFEPDPLNKNVSLRIRIDGQCLMHKIMTYDEYEKVMDEIKHLASLDVKNSAIIQNGKLKLKRPSGDEINMRVTFIPTQTGREDTIVHISSKAKKIPLEMIGLSKGNYADLINILRQPRGVIFVAGPKGQGITTTLHACLDNINTPEIIIWTAEEPVEIIQNGLRQVPIDSRKGFDFPHVLRSFLKADPDVIMASEIQDLETARLCMEASLKGRLVLSAPGTETILDAIERCLDMGISHLVFADAMLSIIEQRLMKTLCPKCKEKYHPGKDVYEELADLYGKDTFNKLNIPYSNSFSLFRPKGCADCGQTGFKGRMCVSEIFIFTAGIKRMIRRKESPESIYQTALARGMTTLLQDGLAKVLQGHIDFRQIRLTCLK